MNFKPTLDKAKYSDGKPNYFWSVVSLCCPRCRRGPMFKNNLQIRVSKNMAMHQQCPLCGQYMEIEVGFYYGTGYVSYALTVAFTVSTFLAYWVFIGISINDNSIYYWLVSNIILLFALQPYLMRFSRTLWLSFFVRYDKEWKTKEASKPERIIEDQMGNW